MGKHHIMFNPKYFTDEDWKTMLSEMEIQFNAAP